MCEDVASNVLLRCMRMRIHESVAKGVLASRDGSAIAAGCRIFPQINAQLRFVLPDTDKCGFMNPSVVLKHSAVKHSTSPETLTDVVPRIHEPAMVASPVSAKKNGTPKGVPISYPPATSYCSSSLPSSANPSTMSSTISSSVIFRRCGGRFNTSSAKCCTR